MLLVLAVPGSVFAMFEVMLAVKYGKSLKYVERK